MRVYRWWAQCRQVHLSGYLYNLWTIYISSNFHPCLSCWWAQVDSNHRPHAYQACALTGWAMSPYCRVYLLRLKQFGYSDFYLKSLFGDFSPGGDERDRTDDPLLAKQVLSQLSYTPILTLKKDVPFRSPWVSIFLWTLKIKQRLIFITRIPDLGC